MSNLNKIITPIDGFQYSVNIAYDIYDDKKIRSYIPSNSSLQIIEDILASTDNKSTDRARILTGSYGKGKSHLILYILALLAGRDKALFSTAIEKAKIENPDLAKNICDYLDSGKRLLPVIVNANSLDIKSTLLQSLNSALQQANLANIMPSTFFDAAVSKILAWKNDFPDTYKAFEKKIGQSGESFVLALKDYDKSRYDLFVKIYPSLTSGSEFNPLAGSDVIGVYESVTDELKPLGYNGIFVIYDEFGKFLEGSVDKSSAMDIKLIQDFAEKCNRSGAKQLHIMLISHKSIENYIGKLDKNKVDAWKAVSNRFKSISINNDESEIYDMVATVLNRDKTLFEKYIEQHSEQFDALKKVIERDHSFTALNDENVEDFALRCYPLHPYTLLLLPKISELVAQNERTIFTFLSSTERYSVPYFLRTDNSSFPIIEPDYIYDYFEKLFKGEPYGSNVKKQWQITTAALSKLKEYDNPLAEKIVKTIELIYCVNDFEIIPPSWDIICEIYSVNYRWGDIEAAKETLKKAHLLIELLYKPYVRITEGSGHDVLGLIQQEAYKIENITKARDVFNDVCEIKYLYPVQYNDENEVIRYFDFRFINCSELQNIQTKGFVLDTKADGVVFAVLVRTPSELESAISYILSNHNKRAVFILPKDCSDSDSIAINYQAILNLKKQYEGKEIELVEELNYILEDRQNVVNSFIENSYLRFDKNLFNVYFDGVKQEVYRKAQLSQLLSSIMSAIYYRTPKIVNDLIISGCKEKVSKLVEVMKPYKNDNYILVYCGATKYDNDSSDLKDDDEVKQIEEVNRKLYYELGMKVHKFTSEESKEERDEIKRMFASGTELQVITAIKCLDEGVNIPAIKKAFILASSTNPKEYIQRRGRVLRRAKGKEYAEIFDFITLPRPLEEVQFCSEEELSCDLSLVRKEFLRMIDFAETARNPFEIDKLKEDIQYAYNQSFNGGYYDE